LKKTAKHYQKNKESYKKKLEYDKKYNARPDKKDERASRGRARYALMKDGRVRKGDGKDVAHKDNNPKNNSSKNLKIQSASKNRAHGMTGRNKSKRSKK
jgi:hypothetical protein